MSENLTDELYGDMLQYSHAVLGALNTAGIKPAPSTICAVMIVVIKKEGDGPSGAPVGCSLNYKDGKWVLVEEAAEIQKA